MIVYDYSAEYAALIIVTALLLSFSRNHDTDTIEYGFIKTMYKVALVNSLVTIAAIVSGTPGTGFLHTTMAWSCNVIYFLFTPVSSLCFLIYAKLVTVIKFDRQNYRKKLRPVFLPYLVYVVVVIIAMACGKIFTITQAEGYVRGPWYQIPYVIVAVNLLYAAVILGKNVKFLHRGLKQAIFATIILAGLFLVIQFQAGNTIMTGIIHTACILSLHLHTLNVKKDTDQMTGVCSRMHLMSQLAILAEKKDPFVLYVFSLRSTKTINERYGIEYGDRVLIRMAQLFLRHTADSTVYRYGGDEFALLLESKEENHQALIQTIVKDLDTVQTIDGHEITLDYIYTRVDYGLFGDHPRALVSAVDYSLSSLKERGQGARYIYDPTVVQALIHRANVVQQIKDAMEGNTFEVHYQPIYCHKTGTFTQAEALVRMRNGEGYLVYPGDFIDLAVKTGLIVHITYMILEQVCQDLRHMMDKGGEGFTLEAVSVNFPYLQFSDDHMQEKVLAILNRYEILPSMIKIEITEREMIADVANTRQAILDMEEQGFAFELDDFGMDYSNMSVVLSMPLDTIKLDRSFLLAALKTEVNRGFFRHLVQGIAGMGATIICEGVEDREQLEFALSCGCQYIQGYFFSKPLEKLQLECFLAEKMKTNGGALCEF